MMDSSSFSSLLAEADKHLSNLDICKDDSQIGYPTIKSLPNGTLSETRIPPFRPGQGLSLPNFMPNKSSITNVLANQISNMLRNQELRIYEGQLKRQQEQQKLQDKNDDYIIDLVKTIRESCKFVSEPTESLGNSRSSSCISLEMECDIERTKTPPPLLPCKTDMSYILHQKIKKGKCSPFGKVLVSRLKRIAAPYFHEEIPTTVKRFDFKTKSPCDLIKEKMRQPSRYNAYDYDIMKIIMADYRESDD